jgi:hypothetical protein
MPNFNPADVGWTLNENDPMPGGLGIPWRKLKGDAWIYG